jgi:hypothetical protein
MDLQGNSFGQLSKADFHSYAARHPLAGACEETREQ